MYTFLLADDSTTVLDVLVFSLEKFNYQSFIATRREQIFSILEKNNVDVLLLGDKFDGQDGIELAHDILEYRDVIVLMMSYSQDLELKLKAKEAGVMGWIVKPFIPERLISIIVKTYFK